MLPILALVLRLFTYQARLPVGIVLNCTLIAPSVARTVRTFPEVNHVPSEYTVPETPCQLPLADACAAAKDMTAVEASSKMASR